MELSTIAIASVAGLTLGVVQPTRLQDVDRLLLHRGLRLILLKLESRRCHHIGGWCEMIENLPKYLAKLSSNATVRVPLFICEILSLGDRKRRQGKDFVESLENGRLDLRQQYRWWWGRPSICSISIVVVSGARSAESARMIPR